MKTRITRPYASCVELIVDTGKRGERLVLASMTLVHNCRAWMLTDIRLHPHREPSEYSGGLRADDVSARHKPESAEEAAYVHSILRDYREDRGYIIWSTFAGLVKGTPRDHILLRDGNDIGYFSKSEGMAKLDEIQAWWDAYTGPLDAAKLANPLLQPSQMEVLACVYKSGLLKEEDE